MIIFSIWNYLFQYEATLEQFKVLGYPEHLIHPLITAQTLGLIIIISNRGKWLIEWAYAGFFMNLLFAIIAHYVTQKGNGAYAVLCLIFLIVTYVMNKQRKYQRENLESRFTMPKHIE